MSIKNNKNNKNICLVLYIWKYGRQKLHYYIVYYIFPDIKNNCSVLWNNIHLYIIYTL